MPYDTYEGEQLAHIALAQELLVPQGDVFLNDVPVLEALKDGPNPVNVLRNLRSCFQQRKTP